MADKKKNVSRRTALVGIGTLALGGIQGVGAANRTKSTKRTILLKGDQDDPITETEIEKEIKNIAQDISGNAGENNFRMMVPKNTDDLTIAAYLMHISDDGIPTGYIGLVPESSELGILNTGGKDGNKRTETASIHAASNPGQELFEEKHNAAEEYKSYVEAGDRVTVENSNELTTASADDFIPDKEWEIDNDFTFDMGGDPYGRVIQDNYLWQEEGYGGGNYFAMGNKVDVIPGTNEYNSDWEVSGYGQRHNWSESDFPVSDPRESHEPDGAKSGSEESNATISANNIGVSWTYTQEDLNRRDGSNSDKAEWEFTWNDNHDSTEVLKLGSTGEIGTSRPGMTGTIFELRAEVEWRRQRSLYDYTYHPHSFETDIISSGPH